MAGWRKWLLPALLATAQFGLWPGPALIRGETAGPRMAAAVALVAVIAAALAWRGTAPVPVTAVVAAGIGLGTWLGPGDEFAVISLADLVALFSVAVRCSRRTTAVVLAGLVLWQAALLAAEDGLGAGYPLDLLFAAGFAGVVAAGGRLRRRWIADRAAAARRLAKAEQARREAAADERRRLARELHDVTAHHLTSIVVNASAAEFLGDQRPELRAEALAFAARTGRETLSALRQLVAVLPAGTERPPTAVPSLANLADDFRQLGQVINVEVAGVGAASAGVGAASAGVRHREMAAAAGAGVAGVGSAEVGVASAGVASAGVASAGVANAGVANAGVASAAVAGEPAPEVAGAVYAIAREALTNTLRYAPGGIVRLRLTYAREATELVVEDDGGVAPSATAGLGGGRGVTGMRERAEALGGTLTAGPRADRGWRVRALLPTGGAAGLRLHRVLRSERALDAGLVFLALVLPLAAVTVSIDEDGLGLTSAALVVLAVGAHAVPLLWRRRHPWWVLGVVLSTTWLTGPPLVATREIPNDASWPFLLSFGADLAAVYAVAARGARPGLTWLAPVAALASTSLVISVLAAFEPPVDDGEVPGGPVPVAVLIVAVAVFAGVILALPFAGSWLAGHTARQRRQSRRHREEYAVAAASAQAVLRACDERSRVATGLRHAVLASAAQVPQAAERADLAGVLDAAREALAAMRALLDGLGTRPIAITEPDQAGPPLETGLPQTGPPRPTGAPRQTMGSAQTRAAQTEAAQTEADVTQTGGAQTGGAQTGGAQTGGAEQIIGVPAAGGMGREVPREWSG